MREDDSAFVDKTSAIADFLIDETVSSRAILTRPRRFGKSLNLDIMGHMLRAGSLPSDVKPWEHFEPEDTERLFGGLDVHRRWQAGEPAVKRLLEEAHFVVTLSLGSAMTGAKLGPSIVERLMDIARYAFGSDVGAAVEKARTTGTAGDALRTLIAAVPRDVPVAVLVDEYDAAILADVEQQMWVAAREGVAALRSLMMLTTHQHSGARIRYFIAAGVARFYGALAAGGASDFVDGGIHPLVSRMLGLSEAEVRSTFPAELARLGQHARLRAQAELAAAGMRTEDVAGATDADVGIRLLQYWYGGNSFDADGKYSCLNTTPALAALDAGRITDKLLEAARRPYWLGVPAAAVLRGYADGACDRSEPKLASSVGQLRLQEDIADVSTHWTSVHSLSAHRFNARSMLQQVGLLTLTRLGPLPGAATVLAQAEAAPTPDGAAAADDAALAPGAHAARAAAPAASRSRSRYASQLHVQVGNDSARPGTMLTLAPPNEYARRSLLALVATVVGRKEQLVIADAARLQEAAAARDHDAFGMALQQPLGSLALSAAMAEQRVTVAVGEPVHGGRRKRSGSKAEESDPAA